MQIASSAGKVLSSVEIGYVTYITYYLIQKMSRNI